MPQDYLIARVMKTKVELARVIRDAEEWNRSNPDFAIDPDPGGILASKIEELDRLLNEPSEEDVASGPASVKTSEKRSGKPLQPADPAPEAYDLNRCQSDNEARPPRCE